MNLTRYAVDRRFRIVFVAMVVVATALIPLLPNWLSAVVAGLVGGALCKAVLEGWVESHSARDNSTANRSLLGSIDKRVQRTTADAQRLTSELRESITPQIEASRSELTRLMTATGERDQNLERKLDSIEHSIRHDLNAAASDVDELSSRLKQTLNANEVRLSAVEELASQLGRARGGTRQSHLLEPMPGLSLPREITLATAIAHLRGAVTQKDD